MSAIRSEAPDLQRREVVGQLEAEDLGVERQFRLECPPLVDGHAEAMALPFEEDVGVRQPVPMQRAHDALGVVARAVAARLADELGLATVDSDLNVVARGEVTLISTDTIQVGGNVAVTMSV